MVISDNGASSEGGASGAFNEMSSFNNRWETVDEVLPRIDELGGTTSYNHYPWGWSWAGNTPFRRWKKEVYRGGVTDPFVVSWPAGMAARGEIRSQYAHAIDMVPTVLAAIGIEAPTTLRGVTQSPLEGVSFKHTLDGADEPSHHVTQYFEMFGQRAIDHDGWRAVCGWPGSSYADGAVKGPSWGARSPPRSSTTSTRRGGRSSTSPTTRPSHATWRRSARGGRRPASTACSPSTGARSSGSWRSARSSAPSGAAMSTAPGCRSSRSGAP